MMKQNGNILKKIIIALVLCLALPICAYADETSDKENSIEEIDTYNFAKTRGASQKQLDAITNALNANPNKIPCGRDEFCDLSTHNCWRLNTAGSMGFSATEVYSYECLAKSEPAPSLKINGYPRHATRCQPPENCAAISSTLGIEVGSVNVEKKFESNGKKYQLVISKNNVSIQYANEDSSNGAIRGCEVLPVKLYNYRKCMFCPLVGTVYDGVAKITDISFGKMAGGFAVLLALGFAIWIALQVLTQVSSLTKQDAPKFLGGLIKQSYKVLIAFLLLQYSGQVFKYAVNPIVETGLTFGENMLTYTNVFSDTKNEDGSYARQARTVIGGDHLGLALYDKLEKYVVSIQQQIAFMETIGTSLVCTGGNLMMFKEGIFKFGDGFQMFVQGAVIAVFAFLLSLAFAFYLLDAIVQIGVVGGLLPFMIAAWPFKATSNYTSTGVGMLMNSAFLFLFLGLIMGVNTTLLEEALGTANGTDSGSLYEIGLAINGQNEDKLKELTDISAVGFMILLFCCIFGFKFTNQAAPLANKFAAGGIGKGIAPGIATMGASFTKSAALRAAKPVTDAVGKRADRAIRGAASLPFRAIGAGYRKLRGAGKSSGAAGGNPQNIGSMKSKPASSSGSSQNMGAKKANAQNTATNRNTLNEGAPNKKNVLNEGQLRNGQPTAADSRTLNEGRQNESENDIEDTEDNTTAPEEFETSEPTNENTGKQGGAETKTNQQRSGNAAATGSNGNARAQVSRKLNAALKAQNRGGNRNRKAKGGSRRRKRGGYKR